MPEQVVKNNPRLLLNSAWAYLAEGKMLEMIQCIAEIQKFGKLPEELNMEITALSSSNPVNSEIESEKILLKCRHALQLLPPTEFLAQLICFNMGGLFLAEGRIAECLHYFEQCYKKSLETGETYLTVISKKAIVTSEIRNGCLQKAEQEIAEVLKFADALNTEILLVIGLLYAQMAEIYYLRNQLEEAKNMAVMGCEYGELGEDIWTAEEQENIRFFINEGDIMEGLLYKLIEKEKAGGKVSIFAQTLLLHFEKQPKENSKLSEEALSRREIEILNLVAKGANNEEIAGLLFITKNTVKTHLLNIYTKLDVHNRIKAAAKAEKLNLI